jgi:hypothetical protein
MLVHTPDTELRSTSTTATYGEDMRHVLSRSRNVLLCGVLAMVLAGSCGGNKAALKEVARGSCQSVCAEHHPDSLYDQNKCLEDC